VAFSISGGALPAHGADRDSDPAAPFELYCAGCHALGAGGGREGVPDLSALATKYGTPLPRARLVEFVVSDHRMGGPSICGERVFGKLPGTPFKQLVERATVRDALAFVEAVQQEK
jgi:hypothetical protein